MNLLTAKIIITDGNNVFLKNQEQEKNFKNI